MAMPSFTTLLFLCPLLLRGVSGSTCDSDVIVGSVPLSLNGVYEQELYVLVEEWGADSISIDNGVLNIKHGPRFYLASNCASSFSDAQFWKPPLSSYTLSATVDVSELGCACNGAFYLVNMPANDATSCGDYCK